jgi:hypothetical protein
VMFANKNHTEPPTVVKIVILTDASFAT